MPSSIRRAVDGAHFAITFLTVVPLPGREGRGAADGPAWFSAVGALIGAFGAAIYAPAQLGLGPPVAGILAVAGMIVVTGGLHHDGLADCADAIGVRGDSERRLAVMRESTIGTYGALALVLWVLLTTSAVSGLSPHAAVEALVISASVGRWAALLHARWAPPARPDGLGASFAPSLAAVLVAGLVAVALAVALNPAAAPFVLLAAGLTTAGVTRWARRSLGGRTGDSLGATVVLTEAAVVLVLVASG